MIEQNFSGIFEETLFGRQRRAAANAHFVESAAAHWPVRRRRRHNDVGAGLYLAHWLRVA